MTDISSWIGIVLLLLGILAACEVFTNAIENLGERLNLSHEFTGSILAAIGTALPETILPLVAIYMASTGLASEAAAHKDIAIGAILGAPFMLGTLAMFLLGLSILTHKKQRKSTSLNINLTHLNRDLIYFLQAFLIAGLATMFSSNYLSSIINYLCSNELVIKLVNFNNIPTQCDDSTSMLLRIAVALVIIGLYVKYLIETYKASKQEESGEDNDCPVLYLERFFGIKVSLLTVIIQTLIGLAGIIYFAHGFVETIEHISKLTSISPMVLSLIISPIATELPEKVNSWIWSSQGKDTLAMGNLSGAMVFQASIPCVIGIVLTPWQLNPLALACAVLAIISSLILLAAIKFKKEISYKTLMVCGSLYLIYLGLIFVL